VGASGIEEGEWGKNGDTDTDFVILEGCTFLNTTNDPCFITWRDNALDRSTYATNEYALGIVQQTSVAAPTEADIIIAGVPANFQGYFPGYSNRTSADARHWTWLVLKAHSRNNAGTVTLSSSDPRVHAVEAGRRSPEQAEKCLFWTPAAVGWVVVRAEGAEVVGGPARSFLRWI
jgi:choline dehydrogenase